LACAKNIKYLNLKDIIIYQLKYSKDSINILNFPGKVSFLQPFSIIVCKNGRNQLLHFFMVKDFHGILNYWK